MSSIVRNKPKQTQIGPLVNWLKLKFSAVKINKLLQSGPVCFSFLIVAFVALSFYLAQKGDTFEKWAYLVPGHWDAGHYLSIATSGYRAYSAHLQEPFNHLVLSIYHVVTICGFWAGPWSSGSLYMLRA